MNFALASVLSSPAAQAQAKVSTSASGDAGAAAGAQHRKLTDAAQQFEGMLLEELLKPLRERSFGSGDPDSGDDNSESSGFADTLASFGSESLAKAISRSGGLGIAKLVTKQIEHETTAHRPGSGGE